MSSAVDRVRHLLRNRGQGEPARLFIQMDEYEPEPPEDGPKAVKEWLEVRRWIRYEECVEGHGERWSKPHVSTVSLQAMLDFREELLGGCVDLSCTATSFSQIIDTVVRLMTKSHNLMSLQADAIRTVLSMPHRPQFTVRERSKKEQKEVQHTPPIHRHTHTADNTVDAEALVEMGNPQLGSGKSKVDKRFTRKLPTGAEAANLFIGELSQLSYTVTCLIRLKEPLMLEGVTEVDAKTRYLLVLLGPKRQGKHCLEMGRCFANLLCDEVFHQVCHNSKSADDLMAGVDEFLEAVTLLPPSTWTPSMRIDPPAQRPEARKRDLETFRRAGDIGDYESFSSSRWDEEEEEEEEEEENLDPALVRTGRLFGGLVNDVKRRLPWYLSDYKDALHVQCLSSFIFLYFAAFTPIVAFGAILGEGTDNYMASMECIIAGALCGVIYHLFAGQALTVLGPTGPMMVLEIIVFHFAADYGLNFLSFRLWIGLWTSLFLVVFVMFDLSALVAYITRFTEEAFAFLISAIFIYDAIKKVVDIKDYNDTDKFLVECFCNPPVNHTAQQLLASGLSNFTNATSVFKYVVPRVNHSIQEEVMYYEQMGDKECFENNGTLMGCHHVGHSREIFHLSIIWFLLTFTIATALNWFRSCRFPRVVRNVVSDFCVFVAIVLVTGADALIGAGTPKLVTPTKFRPSRHDRGWLVPPLSNLPWWAPLAAALPAILATILIFMDQQITAVIVNRRENKMKKGTGYHLDLLVVAILVAICSCLGLPWYVASTVVAITHVTSLRKMSECTAPGDVPQFTGIREQRVTGVAAHIMIGLSVLFTPLLTKVPMPVLYGVFLYMGVSSLNDLSILSRIRLMITPPKYQPDYKYIRTIPIRRVHLFTVIQIICLILLLVIKKIKVISMGFPIMVVSLCFVRIVILERLFTQTELKKLDTILPNKLKAKGQMTTPVSYIVHGEQDPAKMNGASRSIPAEAEVPLVSMVEEKPETLENGVIEINHDVKDTTLN